MSLNTGFLTEVENLLRVQEDFHYMEYVPPDQSMDSRN